jgi:hypothetical protein
LGFVAVTLSDNENGVINDLTVDLCLPSEAAKRVSVGLDLEGPNGAVYNHHVCERLPLIQPKLFEHHRVRSLHV